VPAWHKWKQSVRVGTNKVDLTENCGSHWRSLTFNRYHSVASAPNRLQAYIPGQNGR
jgi:hypothetical protein